MTFGAGSLSVSRVAIAVFAPQSHCCTPAPRIARRISDTYRTYPRYVSSPTSALPTPIVTVSFRRIANTVGRF
jgi:hypothetical protein